MTKPRVAGTGLTGLVGSRLVRELSDRYDVVKLPRWDQTRSGEWDLAIDGALAVVNLSGAGIAAGRWTPARKKELISSRLVTTRAVVESIGRAKVKPKVFLSASAVGYYGPRGAEPVDEEAPAGLGFLSDLCREWERQARKAEAFGVRVVLLRTGVVLDPAGGALAKMLPPFRIGLGGPLGDGKQAFPWIHASDETGAIAHALETTSLRGAVNLAAPSTATMDDFSRALARTLGRPAVFRVPGTVLKALLGEMADMLLTGQNARPAKLLGHGYRFRHPDLEPALRDLLRKGA